MDKEIQLSFDFKDETIDNAEEKNVKSEVNVYANAKPNQEPIHERASRRKLRVTFPDGTVYCDKSSTQTMMKAIEHIGTERVMDLGMECCHIPLISDKIFPRYEMWTKPIGNGLYIFTQADTEQKCHQLLSMKIQLNLDIKIEMGEDFTATSSDGQFSIKKKKLILTAKFSDGATFKSSNINEAYIWIISHIGIDKTEKAKILISGKTLITPSKKYNNQQQIYTGQWLTIPNLTKDKYKALRVIAAMTHAKLEISLV